MSPVRGKKLFVSANLAQPSWTSNGMRFWAGSTLALVLAYLFIPSLVLAQVMLPNPQPICTLSAKPSVLEVGSSARLTWTSKNANAAGISGVGAVALQGSVLVSPKKTTAYVGTFTGPGGVGKCYATVIVNPHGDTGGGGIGPNPNPNPTQPPPTPSPSPSPFPIVPTTPAFTAPSPATANNTPQGALVQCGNSSDWTNLTSGSISCGLCDFGKLAQRVINFMIGIAIPICAALFAWAGILLFTSAGDPGRMTKAKAIFKSVGIGFVIALTGWMVVQTILSVLVTGNPWIGANWNSLQCGGTRVVNKNINEWLSQLPGLNTTAPAPGINTGGTPNSTGGETWLTYSPGVSSTGVNPDLLQSVTNDVSLANAGTVNITSTTGGTHVDTSNHYTGDAVDVTYSNSQFNTYIQNNFTSVPNQIAPGQPAYQDPKGYIWTYEPPGGNSTGPHWHVSKSGR